MFTRKRFKRFHSYGLTVLELSGPEMDIQFKVLSRLDKRERRQVIRSLIAEIRPWLDRFSHASIDHSSDGLIRSGRAKSRGVRVFNSRPISTLEGGFGFRIRMRRLELGLTQVMLASKLGIQRSHLSDIERGLHFPNATTRQEIERVLELSCR